MKLTRWQRLRSRAFLFAIGVRRRLTLGARAVLLEGRTVLLVRQTYYPGWHFPGGGVEPGETAEAAAAREAMEETGYTTMGRPQFYGLFLNRSEISNRDHVAVFVWRNFTSQREFAPNLEIAECGWFPVDDLPADTEPGTAQRVREIFERLPVPAEWLQ
ncbi:MAG: NUDIX domain-containing protein [Devosia sp.]